MSDPNPYSPVGGPGFPPPKKGITQSALIPVVASVLIVGVVVGVLVTLAVKDDGDSPSGPSDRGDSPNRLSHTAVERYIEDNLGAAEVRCNGGQDFEMRANGDSFTCTGGGGTSYTVTIKDKIQGTYVVR